MKLEHHCCILVRDCGFTFDSPNLDASPLALLDKRGACHLSPALALLLHVLYFGYS